MTYWTVFGNNGFIRSSGMDGPSPLTLVRGVSYLVPRQNNLLWRLNRRCCCSVLPFPQDFSDQTEIQRPGKISRPQKNFASEVTCDSSLVCWIRLQLGCGLRHFVTSTVCVKSPSRGFERRISRLLPDCGQTRAWHTPPWMDSIVHIMLELIY